MRVRFSCVRYCLLYVAAFVVLCVVNYYENCCNYNYLPAYLCINILINDEEFSCSYIWAVAYVARLLFIVSDVLNVVFCRLCFQGTFSKYCNAKSSFTEYCYAKMSFTEYCYAKRSFTEYCYAKRSFTEYWYAKRSFTEHCNDKRSFTEYCNAKRSFTEHASRWYNKLLIP